jgi:hypothetical protein
MSGYQSPDHQIDMMRRQDQLAARRITITSASTIVASTSPDLWLAITGGKPLSQMTPTEQEAVNRKAEAHLAQVRAAQSPPARSKYKQRGPADVAKAEIESALFRARELSPLSVDQMRKQVTEAGERKYLFRGLWPAGDYGVIAAERKAQKTMAICDAAVSVASGTAFLGMFPVDTKGVVVMFVGEGGVPNTLRRLDAVAAEHGVKLDDIPIYVVPRAPHLADEHHIAEWKTTVDLYRPVLVTLDPLYLSVGSAASQGSLAGMGELLETAQLVCARSNAALIVAHHFNRQAGRGADRISGAGPDAWGRVVIAAVVKSRHTAPDLKTDVITEWDVIGGEIADQTIRVHRTMWADDPDDLNSVLHVITKAERVEQPGEDTTGSKLTPAEAKVRQALEEAKPNAETIKQLTDRIAAVHGHGLRRETVSRALTKLLDLKWADCLGAVRPGEEKSWIWLGEPL